MKVYLVDKDPTEFLKFSIQREMCDTSLAFIYKQVIEMFDDPNDYRKLDTENPALDEHVRTEYLELFDKCAAGEWSKYVTVEFKTVLAKADEI